MSNSTSQREALFVNGFSGLEQFGILSLTGEACAFSQRMLCDVNTDGADLLADFWGLPLVNLAEPMNSRVAGKPSCGSVMLARSGWRAIAEFALFKSGALARFEREDGTLVGLYTQDYVDRYAELGTNLVRNYALTTSIPHVGSRNIHQATGRVM